MSVAAELANCQLRIKELETRMRQLESALAAMQQHQEVMPKRPAAARPDAFILDDDLVALAAGGEPVRAEPPPLSATAARKQLAVTPPRAASRSPTTPTQASPDVDLSFTDAFSSLDERLKEQLELETRAAPAVTAGHPVLIDAGLIDKAFAKPPPELIHVVSDLEEQYAHLAEKMVGIWGTPECVAFLRKLIVDERGSRQGFPFEVMSELLILSAVAETPAVARAWESEANVAKKAAQAPG
ncbi:MAG: hypothetical protein JWN73_2937 [Betaproteobacteria bacterium]|nr:hypothetical protein [Betaproteobacteria bacterium]